ncbi:major facilitator superfamily MFS_1 [Sandaracinus amylolyticus]|uniref:Major facilitator superfamily MFS_1 n=1 Tax=Sandaracinus amylolyticus TaxID=927083 RepID=A0A0F6W9V8_9BACT|nr:major facilitator superfamily MFS_1 [Sandaracinus amylolyticus]
MLGVESTRRERFVWCLFDFANSAFPTIAITAFGAPYFEAVLVGDRGLALGALHLSGTSAWAIAVALSMAVVVVTSPVMGAIADRGRKRTLLAIYVAVCALATAALGLVPPGSGLLAIGIFVVANVTFEGAYVFYNAFLTELVPSERVGRLSGYGWALGYVGGLGALFVVRPLLPSDYHAAEAARGARVFFVVAGWYALFSLPTLLVLRDRAVPAPITRALIRDALAQVRSTLTRARAHRVIAIFLVAYLLYTDALDTTIHFTGIYTRRVLGFTPDDNVRLFLVLNVIAAPGAMVLGVLADRAGAKRAIQVALVIWCAVIVLAVRAWDAASFWPAAILAAIAIGATQSASRAMMARLAPPGKTGEFMGFLALSGRASAIFGPLIYGAASSAFADPTDPGRGDRIALMIVGALFPLAMLVLRGVHEPRPA